MYQLVYKKAAIKGIAKMPAKIREKMQNELKAIAIDPYEYEGNWKQLAGSEYWRLRVGGYRAICDVQDSEITLLVLKVGPRGDIYK